MEGPRKRTGAATDSDRTPDEAGESPAGADRIVPIGRDKPLPLSSAQRHLWLQLQQLELWERSSYHLTSRLMLRGKLDRQVLRSALDRVVCRHEILRTTFPGINLEPALVIRPTDTTFTLLEQDVQRPSALEQICEEEACKPFDLQAGPLIRGRLLRLSDQEHVLLVTVHQMISDRCSIELILEETCALYEAFAQGEADRLGIPAVQYADYAAWQRLPVNSERLQAQLEFWTQALSAAPELIQLPTNRSRPAVPSCRSITTEVVFSTDLTKDARAFCKSHGTTLFEVALTAWAILLERLSGQEEVLVGTAVSNRWVPGTERMIGPLENIVALRVQLNDDLTVAKLLERVKTVTRAAYDNRDVPLAQVLRAVERVHIPNRNPVIQTLLSVNDTLRRCGKEGALQLTGVEIVRSKLSSDASPFDLTLSLQNSSDALLGTIAYSIDLFDREAVERWAEYFITILSEMFRDADQRICELQCISGKEWRQLVHGFNDAKIAMHEKLIHELFEEQAMLTPEAVAVICDGSTLTYRQLNRKADQLANYLQFAGVGPDKLVALYFDPGIDMIVAMLGVLKAGGAYIPVDARYSANRLEHILRDGAPCVLLTQQHLTSAIPSSGAFIIALDSDWGLIRSQQDIKPERPVARAGLANLAYVIYTSGSTGIPKGVMIEHRSIVNYAVHVARKLQVKEGSGSLVCTSISFDLILTGLYPPLISGRPLRLCREQHDVQKVASEILGCQGLSPLKLTPSHLELLQNVLAGKHVGSCVRVLVLGGETLMMSAVRLWQRLDPNTQIFNHYGPTETTVGCLVHELIEGESDPVPVGRPITNTQIYILDRTFQPVPIGVPGEIFVSGDGVARGYLNRANLTAERFLPNPFSDDSRARLYRTGDLGRWRADGEVEYLGRNDHQVKIRGFRIELGEIESRLRQHRHVKDARVIASADTSAAKRLLAYVVADLLRLKTESDPTTLGITLVNRWQELYEETYSPAQIEGDFIGWNSSYTGEPIPSEEMREWLHATLDRIRSLKPQRVLEIGCGAGLLLKHLAPSCEIYRGSDFSVRALELARRVLQARPDLQHVELERCSALELQESLHRTYDTVIINSVVQYFPERRYLQDVLQKVARLVVPGGRIFIGDVRNLSLLTAFHSSVQLKKAAPSDTIGQLKRRVKRALELEKELVIDPRFFEELPRSIPGIGDVCVLLKRGRANNELTRYRYDVILTIGQGSPDIEHRPGDGIGLSLASELAQTPASGFTITGIHNMRLSYDIAAAKLIESSDDTVTVGHVLELLSSTDMGGEDPEDFWELGHMEGFDVKIGWTSCSDGRSFDVEFIRKNLPRHALAQRAAIARPPEEARVHDDVYTNDPWGAALQQQLAAQLREYLSQTLPPYMVPSNIVMLHEFPLTANRKLDVQKLPAPEDRSQIQQAYTAPSTQIEKILTGVWQEVLTLSQVGVDDNFFELGGHSLLSIKLMTLVADRLFVNIPFLAVFQHPTVRQMAHFIAGNLQCTPEETAQRHMVFEEHVM